jgi:alpha-D-ribose 1-methylphosphonate 5-triphosphate synthase subunit PhnG
MTRRLRTEVFIRGERALSKRFAAEVRSTHHVTVLQNPDEGMVMLTVRESARNSLFHMGEVFVTEARVQVGEALGLGLVRGFDEELALDLAVIDAAYNGGLQIVALWETELLNSLAVLQNRDKEDFEKVLATQVAFESMDREA